MNIFVDLGCEVMHAIQHVGNCCKVCDQPGDY